MRIEKNKVYSSYFAKASKEIPDKYLVSIAIETPNNWGGWYCRELNPPRYLLYKFKNSEISKEEFKEAYVKEVLSKINALELYNKLKGKVICCWERSGEFCHRHIAIEWLKSQISEELIIGEIEYD